MEIVYEIAPEDEIIKNEDEITKNAEEIFENKEEYMTTAVIRRMRDPEELKKNLQDGRLIFIDRADNRAPDHVFMIRRIGRLTPLMLAVYLGEFRLAEEFLGSSEYGKVSEDDILWNDVVMPADCVEQVFPCRPEDPFSLMLTIKVPERIALEIMKRYVLSDSFSVKEIEPGDSFQCGFDKNSLSHMLDRRILLTEKLFRYSPEAFARFVEEKVFAEILGFLGRRPDDFTDKERQSLRRILKKRWELGGLDELKIRNALLPSILTMQNWAWSVNLNCVTKYWKKITGKPLVFRSSECSAGGGLEWFVRTGPGVRILLCLCDEYVHDCEKETGLVKEVIDLNSEEVLLMALQKDVITGEQAGAGVKLCCEKKKWHMIPPLLLKQYGELPQIRKAGERMGV